MSENLYLQVRRCLIFARVPTRPPPFLENGIATIWNDHEWKRELRGEETMSAQCTHLNQIKLTNTDEKVCPECVKLGDTWVHLRLCLICGHVGCCDSSKNKHATKHFLRSKHPLVRSIEPGE